MEKPLFIIVNGLPGTGKTTLAKRLAQDIRCPQFSRDGIYETLYDALDCRTNGCPPLIAPAAFTLLYSIAESILSSGQSLVVEGFFGRPELRSAEFLKLKQACDYEPLQIMCKADGEVLLNRFLTRAGSTERHDGHRDLEWIEQKGNRKRLLNGDLVPLSIGGTLLEVDTTCAHRFDYPALLRQVLVAQQKMRRA